MTNQGQYSNPLVSAYLFPRGDDFSLIKNFERWDEARKISVQFWPQGEGDLVCRILTGLLTAISGLTIRSVIWHRQA